MSDHIKRLEEALTTGGRLYAGPVLAQDLRRTLADVERMRGALELIVAGYRQCTDNLMSNSGIARQALSAGGTHD